VVIVTAFGSVPDAVAAMRLGAIDVLPKPMTPEALRGVVAEVLARHRAAGPVPDPKPTGPAPAAARFVEAMTRAKRALNRLEFDEADFFLAQALALDPGSPEALRLAGVLRESRREREGPYHVLRDLFPVGRPRRGAK
jgi:DNA-binding response OmpR family regulator